MELVDAVLKTERAGSELALLAEKQRSSFK